MISKLLSSFVNLVPESDSKEVYILNALLTRGEEEILQNILQPPGLALTYKKKQALRLSLKKTQPTPLVNCGVYLAKGSLVGKILTLHM